jgi:hypothetical protein
MGAGSVFVAVWMLAYLGFFLLLVVACARTVWMTVTLPAKYRGASWCERCRYPAAGLQSFRCPECGTDLRITGIGSPAAEVRRRGSLAWALIAWSVLTVAALILAYVIAFALLDAFGRRSQVMNSGPVSVTVTNVLRPTSQAFSRIELEKEMNAQPGLDPLTFRVVLSDASSSSIEVDLGDLSMAYDAMGHGKHSADTSVTEKFTAEAALDWLEDAGVDTISMSDEAKTNLLEDVADLERIAVSISSAPYWDASSVKLNSMWVESTSQQSSVGGTGGGPQWTPSTAQRWGPTIGFGLLGMSAIAWIGGMWWIVRRRRALVRRVSEETARLVPGGVTASA